MNRFFTEHRAFERQQLTERGYTFHLGVLISRAVSSAPAWLGGTKPATLSHQRNDVQRRLLGRLEIVCLRQRAATEGVGVDDGGGKVEAADASGLHEEKESPQRRGHAQGRRGPRCSRPERKKDHDGGCK